MSARTAVVAFNIGGNSDNHSQRKWLLADKISPDSLSSGIQWVLKNEPEKLVKMQEILSLKNLIIKCIKKIRNFYSPY